MCGAKSGAGGAGERTGPQVWARGAASACSPTGAVGDSVLPRHGYPGVTPNPSWPQQPLGQAVDLGWKGLAGAGG